jgi:large subunit ribosomal protein L25
MATVKEIKATARARAGKGAARAVRRAGRVPGVIYGDNQPPLNISLDHAELRQRIYAKPLRRRCGWHQAPGDSP